MPVLLRQKGILAGVALILLAGCAAWQVNKLASSLPAAGASTTLARQQALKTPGRDRAQHLLNTGLLKLYTGDFVGSRQDLQQAKQLMRDLEATSVTENLAAATANETLRSYSGSATDRVLVHTLLALSYLLNGDLQAARVEILQADVTMQGFDGEDTYGHLAVARFLGGLVFEISGERDDALISYRRAYNILIERDEPIPSALQLSLLNLTRSQGFDGEYADYKQRFGREADPTEAGEGHWFMLYFDGLVSQKTQNHLSVFNRDLDTLITVVMPFYPPITSNPRPLQWQVGATDAGTAVIENIERRARQDLKHDRPAILAAATARAVAKYHMVKEARNQSDLAGLLTNIATVASEQADLRSWNMLPAYMHVARITAPLDSEVRVPAKNFSYWRPADARGNFVVLFSASYSEQVFSYPERTGNDTATGIDRPQ